MKISNFIIVSALISTLSLPSWAASNVDQDTPVPMNQMAQNSGETMGNVNEKMPNGMPMNMQGKMNPQKSMPVSATGVGQHAGSMEGQQSMNQGGMDMPMMKMMPQQMAEMKQHSERVETLLSSIESSLQQLVELQKAR